jgi:hypothetical protein
MPSSQVNTPDRGYTSIRLKLTILGDQKEPVGHKREVNRSRKRISPIP